MTERNPNIRDNTTPAVYNAKFLLYINFVLGVAVQQQINKGTIAYTTAVTSSFHTDRTMLVSLHHTNCTCKEDAWIALSPRDPADEITRAPNRIQRLVNDAKHPNFIGTLR